MHIKKKIKIDILKNKEKRIKDTVDHLKKKKSKFELLDLRKQYYEKSGKELMNLHIEKAFDKSLKEIRKELKNNNITLF